MCECKTCRLASLIGKISERCSEEEKSALGELWDRMEDAETNLDMIIGMAQDGETIKIAGKVYRAENDAPIQQMLRGTPGRN